MSLVFLHIPCVTTTYCSDNAALPSYGEVLCSLYIYTERRLSRRPSHAGSCTQHTIGKHIRDMYKFRTTVLFLRPLEWSILSICTDNSFIPEPFCLRWMERWINLCACARAYGKPRLQIYYTTKEKDCFTSLDTPWSSWFLLRLENSVNHISQLLKPFTFNFLFRCFQRWLPSFWIKN